MKNIISQKGATSIVLATLLLTILLIIGLGMAVLMLQQIKMSGQAGQSVVAYYAAEAGAERCLYQVRKETGTGCDIAGGGPGTISGNLDFNPQASYTADYNGLDTITSTGRFMVTNRKVELIW